MRSRRLVLCACSLSVVLVPLACTSDVASPKGGGTAASTPKATQAGETVPFVALPDSTEPIHTTVPDGTVAAATIPAATVPDATVPDDTVPDTGPRSELDADGELVLGPGDFTLADTTTGLKDLAGYRATLVLSFDGTRAGAPEKWSTTYTMLASKEPATRQLTIEKSGALPDTGTDVMAEAAGVSYEAIGDRPCTAAVIDDGASPGALTEPAASLFGVHGAEAAGTASIAGAETDHYTFDDSAIGQQDVAPSTGEMWVAADRPLVVAYRLTTKAGAEYFGDGLAGTMSWDYQLTDIDAPATFTLPAGCPDGLVDAPLLADAANVSSVPGALTYETASGVADAAAFYEAQLPVLGWAAQEPPTATDAAAFLAYQGPGGTLTVLITAGTMTTVTVLLER